MARPLRIDIAGGWYHVTARGQNRQAIYRGDRDRVHFLELLEEMVRRFGVEVHGYALMANHYHLILRTPEANASRAMQWLNVAYSVWWNRKHGRSGHVFQGRFKSILVEEGRWLLELSLYLHFNPVALKGLGWGKREKKAEASGWVKPSAEVVRARLETLRGYRWSSYRGYAGYEPLPGWVSSQEILGRVRGGREGYRRMAEETLRQGQPESVWARLKWGSVLGSQEFAEKVKRGLRPVRESSGRRALRRRSGWAEVVSAVEKARGERWVDFRDRHGDWGRDLILWLARRTTGLTLKELGQQAGGMDYAAVSEAVRSFEGTKLRLKDVQAARKRAEQFLNLEM
jgi:putative transposase